MTDLEKPLMVQEDLKDEDNLVHPKEEERSFWDRALSAPSQGSLRLTCLFLVSSATGAGFLSMPSATMNSGLGGGIILFILSISLCYYGLNRIFMISKKLDMDDYSDLARWYGGKPMEIIFQLVVVLALVGVLMVHDVTATEMLATFAKDMNLLETAPNMKNPFDPFRVWCLIIVNFLQFLATLTGKEATSLRYFAAVSLVCFSYTIIVVVAQSPTLIDYYWDNSKFEWFKIDWSFTGNLGVFLFSFAMGGNPMPAKAHLYNPTKKRLRKVARYSAWTPALFYIPYTILGYLSFLDATPDVIIDREPVPVLATWPIQVTRVTMAIVLCSANVSLFVAVRICFENFIEMIRHTEITKTMEFFINLSLFIVITFVSIVMNQVVTNIELVGALLQNFISWIFPTLLYLKLTKKSMGHPKVLAHLVLLGFLILVAIITTYNSISKYLNP